MSKPASIGKFVSVAFYFGGVDFASFESNFGVEFYKYFSDELVFLLRNWYMELKNWWIYLTKKWVENYNWVIALFYAPAVKEHLLKLMVKNKELTKKEELVLI